MYSVAFILALLIFGGLAAYLGDLLGYRLGKRRFSLLRLRPRTTARLVGVVVGLLIPGVTVGVTSLLVPKVRDAVFRLDDLHREIGGLQSERNTLLTQRDGLVREASQQRQAAQSARHDAEGSRKDLEAVRVGLEGARERLAGARERVAELRGQAERLGRDRDRAVRDRDDARKGLDEAEGLLKTAEAALDEADRRLGEAQRSVEMAAGEKKQLEQELTVLRDQLTQVREEWEMQHTIFGLRRPILDIDTELVRGVVRRPATVDELTDEIVALLVLADAAAEAAGAGPTEKGRFTAAIFPVDPGRTWERGELPPEEMVLGVVRRQLWGSAADENVVQIKVAGRTFAGEVTHVRFEARPNELVFSKGETIVARRIEAHLDEVSTFEQLWVLIADPQSSEVRRQARAAGLLPNPRTGAYGEITIRELYAAAHDCADRPEPVTVKVQATSDAYTVGPLKTRIVVEPSGGE